MIVFVARPFLRVGFLLDWRETAMGGGGIEFLEEKRRRTERRLFAFEAAEESGSTVTKEEKEEPEDLRNRERIELSLCKCKSDGLCEE